MILDFVTGRSSGSQGSCTFVDGATGYTCYTLFVNGHWNGYVSLPYSHPKFGCRERAFIYIKVHGGVTYAAGSHRLGDGNLWLIGFDTWHGWDISNPKSLEWVISETRRLARQLKEMEDV